MNDRPCWVSGSSLGVLSVWETAGDVGKPRQELLKQTHWRATGGRTGQGWVGIGPRDVNALI